jgi:hypothetical protein
VSQKELKKGRHTPPKGCFLLNPTITPDSATSVIPTAEMAATIAF